MATIPYIHSNGTSREQLLEMRLTAANSLRKAMYAISEMYPNMRDYYLDPSGERWTAACAQADSRMAAIKGVYDDLVAEYDAIEEA